MPLVFALLPSWFSNASALCEGEIALSLSRTKFLPCTLHSIVAWTAWGFFYGGYYIQRVFPWFSCRIVGMKNKKWLYRQFAHMFNCVYLTHLGCFVFLKPISDDRNSYHPCNLTVGCEPKSKRGAISFADHKIKSSNDLGCAWSDPKHFSMLYDSK